MADQLHAMEAALKALADQKKRRTPEQQAHYEWVTRRSDRIQELGVRPKDGVTFAKKGRSAVSK